MLRSDGSRSCRSVCPIGEVFGTAFQARKQSIDVRRTECLLEKLGVLGSRNTTVGQQEEPTATPTGRYKWFVRDSPYVRRNWPSDTAVIRNLARRRPLDLAEPADPRSPPIANSQATAGDPRLDQVRHRDTYARRRFFQQRSSWVVTCRKVADAEWC